jgi:hypothetical protein
MVSRESPVLSPSTSSAGAAAHYHLAVTPRLLQLLVGPLTLAGFVLPWAHGSGLLTGADFTGFSLLRFTGDLQGLHLSVAQGAALWLTRLAILTVPIAAAWQTLLAWRWTWHPGYRISGWYLVAFAIAAAIGGLVRSGLVLPPPGLALVFCAAGLFAACHILTSRTNRPGSRGTRR